MRIQVPLLLFVISLLGASASAGGKIRCQQRLDQELSGSGAAPYECGEGKDKFAAWCDPSDDAKNRNRNVKEGVWERHGLNEGLNHEHGFVVCKKAAAWTLAAPKPEKPDPDADAQKCQSNDDCVLTNWTCSACPV